MRQRTLSAAVGLLIGGGFYLLLIDTVAPPELYAGAFAALACAIGFAAIRAQGFAEVALGPRLARMPLALARVPADLARLTACALAQAAHRRAVRGELRAVPFAHGKLEERRDAGRRALTEIAGSFSPNTIVVGIDPQRDLLLVHQLRRSGSAASLDVLRAGGRS